MKTFWGNVVLILLIFWVGCSKNSTKPGDEGQTDAEIKAEVIKLIEEGWGAFESGDYATAVNLFTDAVVKENGKFDTLRAEALGGRGWSRIYLGEFQKAYNDFDGANRLDISPELRRDIYAGLGMVFNARNMYPNSVTILTVLLNEDPNYQFSHRTAVNAFRLRLLVAQGYFVLGEFTKVAFHLDILEPAQAPHDPNDPEGLLQAIERLRTVQ